MTEKMKRFFAWLLIAALAWGLVPADAMAAEMDDTAQAIAPQAETCINPLYADVITESDLVQPAAVYADRPATYSTQDYASTYEEAGAQLREGMKQRQETLVVYYQSGNYVFSTDYKEIMESAMAHTGVPTEGDSLRWVYAGYGVSSSGYVSGGISYITLTYTMTYYTTASQEAELDAAVSNLLNQVDKSGSDYEKLSAVYDYICANITYDYANLNDASYKLKYTAYAALVNKTAVCQGYAALLYRLALELGIDARLISGTGNGGGHGWNIVRLKGAYYDVDATWDASRKQGGFAYNYFLKCEASFGTDHVRDSEYDTEEFHAAYPMAETDYVPAEPVGGTCGENLTWSLSENGTLTISGTGDMEEYGSGAPWDPYRSDIVKVVISDGVTSISDNAFAGCSELTQVIFQGDAPDISASAFAGDKATAYYPAGNSTWTEDMRQNYGGTLTWEAVCKVHVWGDWSISKEPTCTEPGEESRTCSACGEAETREINALNHSYLTEVTDPTCTEKGYTTHTCANCGDSYVDTYVEPLDHDFGEWYFTKEATCTEDGSQRRDCSRCDEYETKAEPAAGHSFGSWKTTKAATCTEEGQQSRECSRCSHTETQTVNATGHNYKDVVTAPTCTEKGYTTHTCANCGDSYVDTLVEPLDHDFGEWYFTKEATCTEDGSQRRDCSRCSEYETKVEPAAGHSYKDVVTAPTCGEKGYTTHTCTVCGDSYKDTYVNATGKHTYSDDLDTTCNVCGDTRMVKIETVPMYRLYNPNSGEHFYTGSGEERDNLEAAGWEYEGVAWNAPKFTGDPVYRVFNPNSGDHHYTMSWAEVEELVGYGWQYENVAWNSAPQNHPDSVGLYRLYNPNADLGCHHYTGSDEERDTLIDYGWQLEGIGWFGLTK